MNKNSVFEPFKSAKWINNGSNNKNVIVFRKTFPMINIVGKVFLSICGLGFYDAYLNGKRVGDDYFKPAFSDYEKRDCRKNPSLGYKGKHVVYYNEYEVSSMLNAGENALEVLVGNGYYRNDDKETEPFVSYGEKKLIFALRSDDGTVLVVSDETSEAADTGFYSDLFLGDRRDFCWKDLKWSLSVQAKKVSGKLKIQPISNDKVDKIIYPITEKTVNGGILYDFGINHSGGIEMIIRGDKGCNVEIFYAETLLNNGMPNMETARWNDIDGDGQPVYIDQTSEFVLSGEKDKISPLFCWRCYRYVYIKSDKPVKIEYLRSLFIHADLKRNGTFVCSDERVNKLYDACVLTILDNLHAGTLSDCPHREKRAYTGDGQIVSEALLYEFDSEDFLSKWLDDIISAQRDNGYIPNSAPYISGGGGYAWGNAIAEVSDILYRMTGKTGYIKRAFEPLLKWVEYCRETILLGKDNDYGEWLLGDWLAPSVTVFNVKYMSLLCFYKAAKTALGFAVKLNKAEQKTLRALCLKIKRIINRTFLDETAGNYCNGVQGENILPLHLNIVPKAVKGKLIENLRKNYEENGYHIDTGIVSTKRLFETLIQNGMSDIACKIMLNDSYPSYFDMINGETTLCEHWSKKWPDYKKNSTGEIVKGGGDLSHCHSMFSCVLSDMYKYISGLNLSRLNEKIVEINPIFTDYLDSAEASKKTPYGKIVVAWRKKGGVVELTAKIPEGLTAIFGNLLDCGKGVSYKNLKTTEIKRVDSPLKLVSEWIINYFNKSEEGK